MNEISQGIHKRKGENAMMIKKVKGLLKNSKGFTLVELLAVIVILGIIAGIAVPSIGGIIDNSKKDAHIANGLQVISSARLLLASDSSYQPSEGNFTYITIDDLVENGYLERPISPDNQAAYTSGAADASQTNKDTEQTFTKSYVKVENKSNGPIEYSVFLQGDDTNGASRDLGQSDDPPTESELKQSSSDAREKVQD